MYFLVLFVILNFGLFFINIAYKQELTLQKEDAFVRILDHLYMENGLDFIVEYTEHYGHIHNTKNVILFNNDIVYSSVDMSKNFREYMVNEEVTVYIDSSQSINSTLTNLLFYVSNVSLMIVFIVGIYIFYYLSKRKTIIVLNDLYELRSSFEMLDEGRKFTLIEFEETYREFQRVNKELRNSSLIKLDKLKGVNHDLNTSLTVIKSYLEGYKTGRLTLNETEINELLEEVEFNSRLVESLLGKGESSQSIDLSNLVSKVIEKYMSIFSTKNIRLDVNITEGVFVKGYRDDIKRIIQNVLSNAFYYSDINTTVSVSLEATEDIILVIEDEGIGLKNNEINIVFENEYRSEEAQLRNKSGKGIGLYTSRELMREQNGDIVIKEKEKGIIVYIIFSS